MKLFKRKPVMGISSLDYAFICNTIVDEIDEAHARQKSDDAAPTSYMRGLFKALDIINSVSPRNLLEE